MFSREFAFCHFVISAMHLHVDSRHVNETVPLGNITWSDMGNIQAILPFVVMIRI